jgi:hypothetical protein
LHLIVNNARFLILPWIHCENLASRVLALVSRRLNVDWRARYAYCPLLLETFVEKPRFTGTCYKAATGRISGIPRPRQARYPASQRTAHQSIWIYPLVRNFQLQLCYG